MIITIAETEAIGLLPGSRPLTCMFRFCEQFIRSRARYLGTLPRGTLAAYNTTKTFFATFTVKYFAVRNIHLFIPDDIYSTRHLRFSKMFYAIRRCTNPFHPAYTNSISLAKQRSLGAQMRPPHSVTTPSLPMRYCRQIDERVYCLYPLAALRYKDEGILEAGGMCVRAENRNLLNSECTLSLII